MYVESDNGDCFDPSVQEVVLGENGFSQNPSFPLEEEEEEAHTYHHHHHHHNSSEQAAMEMELQQQLNLEMDQCYNTNNQGNNNVVNQGISNWEEMGFSQYHNHQVSGDIQNGCHNNQQQQSFPETPLGPQPQDLLNMFPLPRCSPSSLLPNPSFSSSFLTSLGLFGDISQTDGASPSTHHVVCDPSLLPLNLPPQPPLLRELFHSLPQGGGGYGFGGSRSNSLFGEVDEREVNGGAFYQTVDGRDFENGVFEFTGDMNVLAKNRDGKGTKHFATERQRRVHLNDKYEALKKLVPNPSKNDRASVVHDAIGYINELKRTVGELKILVEKKRCSRERMKRQKTSEEGGGDLKSVEDVDQSYTGTTLRSSWLQRKSKNTEVDVRIIDDEVTVKLVQQKRINCLLFVSKALDELQLDLHHVAGGLIGDYYSFLFNSKICEGSTVYASAIANKLIEVVDKHYTAMAPTSSY